MASPEQLAKALAKLDGRHEIARGEGRWVAYVDWDARLEAMAIVTRLKIPTAEKNRYELILGAGIGDGSHRMRLWQTERHRLLAVSEQLVALDDDLTRGFATALIDAHPDVPLADGLSHIDWSSADDEVRTAADTLTRILTVQAAAWLTAGTFASEPAGSAAGETLAALLSDAIADGETGGLPLYSLTTIAGLAELAVVRSDLLDTARGLNVDHAPTQAADTRVAITPARRTASPAIDH